VLAITGMVFRPMGSPLDRPGPGTGARFPRWSDRRGHDGGAGRRSRPEVVIAEFTYHGTTSTGQPVRRRNIFVITVRDGRILNSRDYQGDA